MRISNAAFFATCAFLCILLAGLMWWDVISATSSGLVDGGKFVPKISRAINPVAFDRQYHNIFGMAAALSIAGLVFGASALVSRARGR